MIPELCASSLDQSRQQMSKPNWTCNIFQIAITLGQTTFQLFFTNNYTCCVVVLNSATDRVCYPYANNVNTFHRTTF